MKNFIVIIIISFTSIFAQERIILPSIFSNNMVLQQNSDVTIWGKCSPGVEINISASWKNSNRVITAKDSTWSTTIKTPKAGGPHSLLIRSENDSIKFNNILTGEVWLCSGQSNMEMPLIGFPPKDIILNSKEEIDNTNFERIRLFSVERTISQYPNFDCIGEWEVCNPENAENFSATAYFFGRRLYQELNIPIGLINSSWGGTPAESWTNKKHLSSIYEFESILDKMDESFVSYKFYENYYDQLKSINVKTKSENDLWKKIDFDDRKYLETDYNDSHWQTQYLPKMWEESSIGDFDGIVWYRKKINIPSTWINKKLTLSLGSIDDMDATYVNGHKVGGYEKKGFWNIDRIYEVPSNFNDNGEIVISIRVIDLGGGGGLFGAEEQLKLINDENKEEISIFGLWSYLPVAEYVNKKIFVFEEGEKSFKNRPPFTIKISQHTPTLLYNGMIAPLIPFKIKGTIWYQGESNVRNPELYETLFPTMIKSWREDWGYDFSFYFTQIAPYHYRKRGQSQYLRDAQRKTLSLKNTGMAVTLDIGNVDNIHPANKKDVGKRLANWALAKEYNKTLVCSGPLYKEMKVIGNTIELTFEYDEGLLIKPEQGENQFIIAGENQEFLKADVRIENSRLILSNKDIPNPKAVRYAWNNAAFATLFNSSGLPASSFRTDDWRRKKEVLIKQ